MRPLNSRELSRSAGNNRSLGASVHPNTPTPYYSPYYSHYYSHNYYYYSSGPTQATEPCQQNQRHPGLNPRASKPHTASYSLTSHHQGACMALTW